ncbi:allergen [Punctularia strigosozonata HHB-11173 SS5]|uniref:allergen n=1 Tax=Punctularia strigosozonata (strain HHB-11173) TaxID=741275 RepID=UPI00044183C3|nr:allergen [Punctularia strigosozonata HHB-11173 SS5]EIN05320.1 allergen [Punctularia strigosozonata HHB-11173 SS5]
MARNGPNVYFDMAINNVPAGRIVFRLFDSTVPHTARNFRDLATGEHGFGYEGSKIHRIVPEFMIQGGDITKGDGTGGRSIYGQPFRDENFALRHSRPWLLSMGNRGPNSNTSQFFITTTPAPWCDGKNVVFGEVVEGQDVISRIQSFASDDILRKPSVPIVIKRCGTL